MGWCFPVQPVKVKCSEKQWHGVSARQLGCRGLDNHHKPQPSLPTTDLPHNPSQCTWQSPNWLTNHTVLSPHQLPYSHNTSSSLHMAKFLLGMLHPEDKITITLHNHRYYNPSNTAFHFKRLEPSANLGIVTVGFVTNNKKNNMIPILQRIK